MSIALTTVSASALQKHIINALIAGHNSGGTHRLMAEMPSPAFRETIERSERASVRQM